MVKMSNLAFLTTLPCRDSGKHSDIVDIKNKMTLYEKNDFIAKSTRAILCNLCLMFDAPFWKAAILVKAFPKFRGSFTRR